MKDGIKIARVNLQTYPQYAQQFQITRLPELILYKNQESYMFKHYFDVSRAVYFANKIMKPVETLNTMDELEDFMNKTNAVERTNKVSKVIGIFFDEEEDEDLIAEYREAAQQSATRSDLEFGIVLNKPLIKILKAKYGSLWFEGFSSTSAILKKTNGKIVNIDLFTINKHLLDVITIKNKKPVDELTGQNMKLYEFLRLPILLSFLDPVNDPEGQLKHINTLEQVAPRFEDKISFAWVDNESLKQKRLPLGIMHNKVPAMALNLAQDQRKFPFPLEKDITVESVTKFLTDFLTNKLQDQSNVIKQRQSERALERAHLQSKYKFMTMLQSEDYHKLARVEGQDALIVFVNTELDSDLEPTLMIFDIVAERFKALKISSVEVGLYDLFIHPLPHEFPDIQTPQAIFFPAYDKRPPFKTYTDHVKVLTLMLYIQENADIKFILPALPHLAENMHEEYYKQKIEMEQKKKEQENENQSNIEL
jgi:hypothetical protein